MLILDDILLFPARGLLWVFREIHNAAQQARAEEADDITDQLTNLYMMLETARISEEEFAAQEKILLDRLEKAQTEQEGAEESVKAG